MSEFLSSDRRNQIVRGYKAKNQTIGTYYDRPEISFGQVWCGACQKPCEFDETCMHNTANPGSSKVVMRAYCHGEESDILMTFQQWHDMKEPRLIVVFADNALPEARPARPLLAAPVVEPLLLMEESTTFD